MRTWMRSKVTLLSMTCAVLLAVPAIALADQVANSLDASVDTTAETMALNEGGSNGTTTIYVNPANGDGKPGCNLQGDSITVSLASSDTSIATVSPSSITLNGCGSTSGKTITVTPVKAGTATITASGPASINGGSLTYGQATFDVTVAPPPNTAPKIQVTGVVDKSQYEFGSVPKAGCSVVDAEDGNKTFDATLSGPNSALGLGNQTASCYYKDAGGLEASAAATYEIVDTTAPVVTVPTTDVTAEATGPNGANVSFNNDVSATDAVYGSVNVDCTPASGSIFGLGSTQVSCTATDGSGNTSAPKTFNVKVQDTTPPKLTLPANITEEATGPNGNAVTYNATASDLVDGHVAVDCTPPSGSTFAIATTTVNCSATDAAGNEATGSFTVKVEDTTAPSDIQFVGNINDNDSFFFGSVPDQPTCTATDGGSGLDSCVVSGYSAAVGQHTLTATAKDKAGNTATKTLSYTVKAWTTKGFYPPVDMSTATATVWNTVKGGSTVPLKFELFAGSELTDPANVKSLQSTKVNCSTANATEDAIEATATGGTSLRYDSTGGQFIYNWKTPTGAGSCYKVTVTANDGSTISAFFKMK
jgi:HYR domain